MIEGKDEIVRTEKLTKVFPDGTIALRGVDFSVMKGEIHGLLGENGAGKTTLTKIISGILKQTSGDIYVRGKRVDLKRPKDALSLGIGMVHQHFTLVGVFTAFENILLGTDLNPKGNDARRARDEIIELANNVGLRIELDELVEGMSLGAQQRVEIIRMLYRNVDLLILDEPTSSLTITETDELFKALRRLRDQGKSVIFITHKLREVMELCDRITVLRQGLVTGRVSAREADARSLARMMVGRDVVFEIKKKEAIKGEPLLIVDNLTVLADNGKEAVRDVSFKVRKGEIFGIAGVEGNGQTELAEAISGVRKVVRGRIILDGKEITGKESAEVRRYGVALIPEDRRSMGLIIDMNVAENTILGRHREDEFVSSFRISWDKVFGFANQLIKRFEIIAHSPRSLIRGLSGGNQQKVVVGRELSWDPNFILASQPTRGLDVAATEYIRNILIAKRDEGKAILLISADLDEILQLSDTVGVMYEGRLIDVGPIERMTRERIGMLMGGVRA